MRFALVSLLLLCACGSESEEPGEPAEPLGPPARQIGTGDGSPASVELVVVHEPPALRSATDLAFDPLRPTDLWVLFREFHDGPPCTESVKQGCKTLEGSVTIVKNPAQPDPTYVWKKDPNAWHFMRLPAAIAFGTNGNFATCSEARTGNFEDDPTDYNGPSLWSSDPKIFAIEPQGKNGSHLDMLHESPFCVGIAHEVGNVYWVFNGQRGSLDRYDFKQPHEVGGENHSDGEILRYVEGELLRDPGIPSHMAYHAQSKRLYVSDTGHGRVVALDVSSGTVGTELGVIEPMAYFHQVDGATLREVVPPGAIQKPSGLLLHENVLFVGDNATSSIHAFDLDGVPIRTLATGLPPGSLGGLEVGQGDRIYISDLSSGLVRRIDPLPVE
jgi:hypothetical protein